MKKIIAIMCLVLLLMACAKAEETVVWTVIEKHRAPAISNFWSSSPEKYYIFLQTQDKKTTRRLSSMGYYFYLNIGDKIEIYQKGIKSEFQYFYHIENWKMIYKSAIYKGD